MVSLLTEGTESAWYLPHLNCHFLPPYAWLYSYKLSKNSHLPNWVIECQACLLKIVKDEGNICIKKILSYLSLAFPFYIWPASWNKGKEEHPSHFFTDSESVTAFPRRNFARLACVMGNSLLLEQEHGWGWGEPGAACHGMGNCCCLLFYVWVPH